MTPEEYVHQWTQARGGVPAWVAEVTPGLVAMVRAAVLAAIAEAESRVQQGERAPMIGWAAALVRSVVGVDDACAEPVRSVAMQIRDWHDRDHGEAR